MLEASLTCPTSGVPMSVVAEETDEGLSIEVTKNGKSTSMQYTKDEDSTIGGLFGALLFFAIDSNAKGTIQVPKMEWFWSSDPAALASMVTT